MNKNNTNLKLIPPQILYFLRSAAERRKLSYPTVIDYSIKFPHDMRRFRKSETMLQQYKE